ncbi:hypothetical protein Tco_1271970 [Tanacetum coccineum]
MNTLLAVQPDAYHKLCEVGLQRWSKAYCPLIRYNYMISNSVESVNVCIVLTRKLPIIKLAETYRAMLQDWYFNRQEVAGTYGESIHFIGDMQEWEFLSHIHPAIPPRMDNPQPGWTKIKTVYYLKVRSQEVYIVADASKRATNVITAKNHLSLSRL